MGDALSVMATAIKSGRAGEDVGPARVRTRGRCAIVAVESRVAAARSSRARGDDKRAARGPRTPRSASSDGPHEKTARETHEPPTGGFERRAYLWEEAVEAVQQVGVSPEQCFHALHDLAGVGPADGASEGSARGGGGRKRAWNLSTRKRQWKPRSFSHAPGVLEVAHDLEELLVRLGARADEPRLHRPDVLQRILGRFPARRDRGSHLTVIDSAPGTRFTRSPEGMRKTTSVRRTRAHDVTRRVYARSIAPNRTRARSGRRCSDVALARGVDCGAAARLRRTPSPVSGISRGRHSSWLATRQTRRFLIQAGLGIFRRATSRLAVCRSAKKSEAGENEEPSGREVELRTVNCRVICDLTAVLRSRRRARPTENRDFGCAPRDS